MTLRYLFCAVPPRAWDLSGWSGEGAPLELVSAQGVGGVLGRVPASRYGARALAKATKDARALAPYAVAHQAVVQYVFELVPAVVPISFGSVHRTRADAIRALAAQAARLRPLLRRLAGKQEWGLRVARRRPERPALDPKSPRAGTAYLVSRRAALRAAAPDKDAARLAEQLARRLARHSVARHMDGGQGDLLLRVSYLVPAGGASKLQRALLASSQSLENRGLVAELSGPWPAYSFSS